LSIPHKTVAAFRNLAVRWTAIGISIVSVITLFDIYLSDSVAAYSFLAKTRALIPIFLVPVVAFFSRLHDAITAHWRVRFGSITPIQKINKNQKIDL
tara:strand:+ start:289 stop:579 length:291 start_codon:yes stop_codon:yes gene_type:complete